ncbi:YgjV family protein [Shewanella sp. 10N.261.52.F9]|uniref:YgjV family protein n=1 Tax=Shewanella sp. 10N.261.52.F9 TaxID=3229684 RepID=UPI00354D1086
MQKVDNGELFLKYIRFYCLVFELSHQALLWVQALGFVSMAIGWWANAQKNDQQLLSGNVIASGLTAAHLGLLGSSLGMMNQLLNLFRFACSRHFTTLTQRRIHCLPVLFATAALVQGLTLAEHWSEWCAVASAIVMSFALFYCAGAKLRFAMLFSNMLNLTLSAYLSSWSGIAYQLVTIIILTYSLVPQKTVSYDSEPAL